MEFRRVLFRSSEAEAKVKGEMESEVKSQKDTLRDSIISLESFMKGNEERLKSIEKELSAIAVDIAKEVIVKEVEANSAKVATELTKELLKSAIDATKITIRVNPADYAFLKESIEKEDRIELMADGAILKGGVVIISDHGNIDGNIASRYKLLKQSVLDNMI